MSKPEDTALCSDEEFEEWLAELREGITIPAPSLSELDGDEDDPWDY